MGRVGLVLAGGGMVGTAFHIGALTALHEASGWDPRDADLIIGTSAGSMIGTMLRIGVAPADQLARIDGREPSAEAAAVYERLRVPTPPQIPRFEPPRPQLPDAGAIARALRVRGSQQQRALLAALIPDGAVPFPAGPIERIDEILSGFPAGLWITAVRVSDGALVVFGRDPVKATVPEAVMASCAIPGFFTPIEIGGERHVDGGLRSMANADLARGQELDAVIVSSPMTFAPIAPGPLGRALAGPLRQRLQHELRVLRREGLPVLVLEPDAALRRTMGVNPMDPGKRQRTATAAREAIVRELAARDLDEFGLTR